jgi:cysteine desulfurase / selenocysteine lyase
MNEVIRDLFPVAQNFTYLNSAAIAPLPTVTVNAVTSQLEDVAKNGSANMCGWFDTKDRVRQLVASMLGAKADDIAFTRNTSDGLCAVASGITWKAGDNIVTFANEFPANFYPWRRLRDDLGVELRRCPERNGRIDVDELCGLIDERTKLVTVSAVQYSSGYRIDLERIGKAARAWDTLLVVDIIQAFGVFPLDLPAQYVDIAAGAGYKWLCAPEGSGIFYISERARNRVKPVSHGWTGVEQPWDFQSREQRFVSNSIAWETGMGGSALLYGLEQSLRLLYETGIEKIATYLAELTDFLCEIIPGGRYEIVSSRASHEKSQIVSIRPRNGASCESVIEHLKRENVVVSARDGCIRVAPHFFNNYNDIERLASQMP